MHALMVASTHNTLHALNRVVSLLRGRDFAIESLTVARSARPDVTRLTIAVDTARTSPERVSTCLEKLEDVWGVRRVAPSEVVRRELALIKVTTDAVGGEAVSALLLSSNARVIEEGAGAAVVELVGGPEEIDRAIGSLAPASILEIARGGQLVMAHGLQKTGEELSLRL